MPLGMQLSGSIVFQMAVNPAERRSSNIDSINTHWVVIRLGHSDPSAELDRER